jgi:hypothetical protein
MTIKKYRRIPIEVTAIQVAIGRGNLTEIQDFCGKNLHPIERRIDYDLKLETIEGLKILQVGNYIVNFGKNLFKVFGSVEFERDFETPIKDYMACEAVEEVKQKIDLHKLIATRSMYLNMIEHIDSEIKGYSKQLEELNRKKGNQNIQI